VKAIVLFDGVCNLCSHAVQFIIRHDKAQHFQFAPQQSEVGQRLLAQHGLIASQALAESVVVIEGEKVWLASEAVFYILYRLGGVWRLLAVLRFLPKGLRDRLYRWVAHNRYRIFGRRESCLVPTPELKQRFLDTA